METTDSRRALMVSNMHDSAQSDAPVSDVPHHASHHTSRVHYIRILRQTLAFLDDPRRDEVVAVQHRADAQLAEWMARHTGPAFAAMFRAAVEANADLDRDEELAQALRHLPRASRAWATFFLEEAKSLRFVVRIRLRQYRSDVLREFAARIVQLHTADVHDLAASVLTTAAALTERPPSWGQVLLFRAHVESDRTVSTRVDSVQTMRFSSGQGILEPEATLTGRFDLDHPPVAGNPIMRASLQGTPRLIADLATAPDVVPAYDARSLICVPVRTLTSPVPGAASSVYGALLVASSRPSHFTGDDLDALAQCGQLAATGLDRIADLRQREDWMHQVMHDMSKTMRPLLIHVRDIEHPLQAALRAPDQAHAQHAVGEAASMAKSIRDLVFLTNDLMYWAADLTDDVALPEDEEVSRLDAATIASALRDSTATLGKVLTGRRVIWETPSDPVFVAGGEARANLIKAALFKYIENGLKYGSHGDVHVRIAREADMVEFAVRSTGPRIADDEIPRLFDLGFRGSDVGRMTPGAGYGLAQVRRIARLLGGTVGYSALGDSQSVFWLRLPAMP